MRKGNKTRVVAANHRDWVAGGFTRERCMKGDSLSHTENWIEQCEDARGIESEFRTQRVSAYRIGEKFINVMETADDDTDSPQRFPRSSLK